MRVFTNNVPTLNASDRIKNIKNKEIYAGVKNSVENNEMKHEKYTFDSAGCLRSSQNYDDFLSLVRGWGQCVTVADISAVINEQEKPGGKALGTFIDKTAPWAQNYRELDLTSFVGDYPVIRDASLNSINNNDGLMVNNKTHYDLSSIEMNHPLSGAGSGSSMISGISPEQQFTALNPVYSASIQVDPSNQLYSICELDDNQKEKWKDLVVTETTNERYHYDLRRIAQRTDWQFSYPRKFNIKHSKVS